jgi:hypothetical protein
MSLFHSDNVRVVVVDSSDRYSGTSSNFSIDLKLPSSVSDFDRVSLNQISIPRSWYDVKAPYNKFYLLESGGAGLIPIEITEGMYNVNTLKAALTSSLTFWSPNNLIYDVYYPNPATEVNTNKFNFVCLTNNAITKQFIFTDGLYQQLGFEKNSTNSFINGNAELYSTNSISISYINRLFLKSNCCSTSQDNVLQDILVAGQFPSTSYIFYENLNWDTNSKAFTNPHNNSWDFQLFDKYGDIVDLNGLEMVFSLTFYKKNKTDELQYETLKVQNMEKLLGVD